MKKTFFQIAKHFKIGGMFSVLFLTLLSLVLSCSNVVDNESAASYEQKKKEHTTVSNTETAVETKSNTPAAPVKKYATICGDLELNGAYPVSVINRIENDDPARPESDYTEEQGRSALPVVPANSWYFIKATCNGTDYVYGEVIQATRAYSIQLELGYTWTIIAGIRASETDVNSAVFLQDSYPLEITENSISDTDHTFFLKPLTSGGNGIIDLKMDIPDDDTIGYVKATCLSDNKDNWKNGDVAPLVELANDATDGKVAKLNIPAIKSGSYEVLFTFHSSATETFPLFTTVQIINVFENMTTSTWADNGNASVINNETKSFKIDTNVLKKYSLTQIYVGSYPGTYGDGLPGKAPSDTNEGTPYSPFSSLNKALSIIDTQNQPANNYTIHITGETTDTANNTISTDRAASITLAGVSSSSSVIRGHGTSSPVLSITTSKPVTFKNIQITGGNNSSGNGGALYLADSSNVTLADGAVISGNTAAKGGAVYVSPQANFKIKGSAKLQFAASDAAGHNDVYLAKDASHKAKITVEGSLTQSSVALITPEDWSRGTQIIQTSGAAVDTVLSKFTISDRDFSAKKLNSNVTTGIIDAPIFIASQANSTYGIGNPADTEDSHGSKSSPFASIGYALKELTNPDFDFTFTIYGNVCGNQIIQNITTENNATSLTLEGFKPAGSTTSDASLSGDGSSTLTVDTGVPVIIKDLKITGGEGTGNGSNNKGGGIYLTNGTVKLADGAHITGNTAYRGGGVYVEDGARLFMYGSSLIGDLKSTTITSAPEDEDDASNSARDGGGLYNNGEVYLGYEDWTNESNNVIHALDAGYGISHNYSSSDAGGIMNGKIIRMASGTIGLNRGGAGGGIMNDNSESSEDINTLNGGVIEDNIADCGGGIYSNNPLKLHGTLLIQNNEAADAGGAVNAVSITLCDSVSIPYGVNNTKAEKKNDVNCWGITPVVIGTNLAAHDSDSPIFITPNAWTRETTVLGAANTSLLTSNISCFATTDEDFTIQQKGTTTDGILKADIFVAGSANSSSHIGTPNDTTTTRGTRKYPFKTLKYALEQICNNSNTDYTVKIFGSISGGSEIPASGFSAKSLTLEGVRGIGAGVNSYPNDYLSGAQTSDPKSALTVNSTVPVTIKKLGVMYGGGTKVGDKIYGGGLYMPVSGSHVTLAEEVWVGGNKKGSNTGTMAIDFGGGVYIGEGASLYMCKTALVGSRWRSNTAQYFSGTVNTAENGAGIYNAGNLYLGYKYENGSMSEEDITYNTYDIPGGLRYNQNTGTGGGLYIAETGTFRMRSGYITLNEAWYGAGIYSEASSKDNAIFEGGYITSNIATHKGSGINIAAGKYFYIKDGTIQSNNNRYTDRLGGAVYCAGTLAIGGNAYFQNGTVAESQNDIAVANTGKIEVESALEKEGTIATLTMAEWTRGYEVLIPGSSLTSGITDAIKNKFVTIDEDFTFALKGTGAATTGALNAPIYVASTANTDPTRKGNAGVTTGARGTRAKPYASLYSAVAACTDSSLPFTIYVDGTVTGGQTIESTASAPINAKSLTITKRPDAVANTHSAVLSGNNLYRTLDITAPDNDFEITITNLLITGGKPTNGSGGGISLHKGTLKLGEGVKVTGNRASYGGGINVASGASLFIYDDAIVGDTIETIAEYDSSDLSKFGNWAQYCGGGISTNGNVYIGYSGINETTHQLIPSTMTTGGVRRNFCSANGGGGIYVFEGIVEIGSGNVSFNAAGNSGGGIYLQKGTINLDSASISSNNSTLSGGAIYMHDSATCSVNITGSSEIINNSAKNSGGAIYISSTGSLTMTAGTIGGSNSSDANIADSDSDGTGDGGAIYNGGTFNISGTAYIPYGGNETHNDVSVSTSNTISLNSDLSKHASNNQLAIVSRNWGRGTKVISKAGTLSALTNTIIGKFKTVDSDFTIDLKSGDTTYAYIDAPIFVSDTTVAENAQRGTSSKPYSTIQRAITNAVDANHKTVTVKGTVSTGQEITSYPSGITAIELTGYKAAGQSSSSAKLEGTSNIATSMLRFTVSSATLTITDLTITKGNAKGSNEASYGGGIYVGAGSVKLGNGTVITKNVATNFGGGVYVENGANLFMYGTALIGESASTSTEVANSTSNCGNYAYSGGGIYNKGNVYLGYTTTSDTSVSLNSNYGVRRNYAYSSGQYGGEGGGYACVSSGSLYIASGAISLNGALRKGGGLYAAGKVAITGGTIESNSAGTDGGGIYVYYDDVSISNATIKSNTASGNGGAAYINSGSLKIGKDADIPGGTNKTNDIYLPSGKYVTLTDAPKNTNGYGYSEKIVLNPENLASGTKVLSGYSYISDNYDKFVGPGSEEPRDWFVTPQGTGTSMIGVINGIVYVASSDTTEGQAVCKVKGNDSTGDGSRSKPYATIAKALTKAWDTTKTTVLTIKIDGVVKGAQTISGSYNAALVYIAVCSSNTDTYSTLNGEFSSATPGTTLTISTNTPVRLGYLKITGGYNTNGDGGGVAVTGTASKVDFNGTWITGNQANNGGGVYINSSSTACFNNHAYIGYKNDSVVVPGPDSDLSTGFNKATNNGGGIYNTGSLYLGYSYNYKTGNCDECWDDEYAIIKSNYCTNEGGGIYTSGETYISSEDIRIGANHSKNGGGICIETTGTDKVYLKSGLIDYNTADTYGGGIYLKTGTVEVQYAGHDIDIYHNIAQYGGGIKTDSGTVFNIDSSQSNFNVYFNEVKAYSPKGGGVYVSGTFFFGNGWIGKVSYSNKATSLGSLNPPKGKGVYLDAGSKFIFTYQSHVYISNDVYIEYPAAVYVKYPYSNSYSEDPPPAKITPSDYTKPSVWEIVKEYDHDQYTPTKKNFKVTSNGSDEYKIDTDGTYYKSN